MLYLFFFILDNEEDSKKFNDIIDAYQDVMFKVAYSVTKDYYDAEDALQIVLLSLARNISHVKTDNENMLKSYLYTAAENAGIDIWRRRMRKNKVACIDDYENILCGDNLYKSIGEKEDVATLVKLIDKIPPRYREVLVFRMCHGKSLCQIADELGRKYSTVRKQFGRGKKMLEKLMKEADEND